MKSSFAWKTLLGVAALALPVIGSAESSVTSGNGANMSTSAHVDFQVSIPRVLFFRVGTGTAYFTAPSTWSSAGSLVASGNNATIDLISFSPAAAAVGNSTPVAGVGGDLSGGVETAALVANGGNVNLTATTTGLLTNATADTIPWSEISVTPSTLNSATALPVPAFTAAAGGNGTGASTLVTASGATRVIQQDAKWTFAYANTTTYPGGVYGGVGPGTSRVTYTATMP